MDYPVDLLLTDDDDEFRATLVRRFSRRGYQVHEANDGTSALELAERRQFDVAIIDMMMPQISGLAVLEKLKASQPECEVIMLTGEGTIESAVNAMKLGAYDYLSKPCPLAELEAMVQKASERRQLTKENSQLKELLQRKESCDEMVGSSAAIKEVLRLIECRADGQINSHPGRERYRKRARGARLASRQSPRRTTARHDQLRRPTGNLAGK